jgi:imidazole glycerol-phosphate synthase subunit HisH
LSIIVPDLGIGNTGSVLRMVERAGGSAEVARCPQSLDAAGAIILAGVGAFDRGMTRLRCGGWADALSALALVRRVPVLGICLGMQLMCRTSEEGAESGLGWVNAEVRRFNPACHGSIKVPHMGWNKVEVVRSNSLLPPDMPDLRFYFVHSYFVHCHDREDVVAIARHGIPFAAAFARHNLYGVQFHPEKSHRFGLALMQEFVKLAC